MKSCEDFFLSCFPSPLSCAPWCMEAMATVLVSWDFKWFWSCELHTGNSGTGRQEKVPDDPIGHTSMELYTPQISLLWKWKWSRSGMSDSLQPRGLWPTRLLGPWILQARILEWGAISFSRGSSGPRSPTLQADTLTSEPPGQTPLYCERNINFYLGKAIIFCS